MNLLEDESESDSENEDEDPCKVDIARPCVQFHSLLRSGISRRFVLEDAGLIMSSTQLFLMTSLLIVMARIIDRLFPC